MNSNMIKELAMNLGADLCGIVSQSSFVKIPEGYRPTDVYEDCKAVIVFAKRMPQELLFMEDHVLYTRLYTQITDEFELIATKLSAKLKELGVCVRNLSLGLGEYNDSIKPENKTTLSLTQAGFLAGLGVFGKNGLLMNRDYGSMISLGMVLVNIDLEGDSAATYEGCPPGCELCIRSCPSGALNGKGINYALCATTTNGYDENGNYLKKCSKCRLVCPNAFGIKSYLPT